MAQDKGYAKVRKMVEADLPRVNEIDRLLSGRERVITWPFSFEAYWAIYRPELSFVAELKGEVVGFLVGHIVQEEHSQSVFNLTRPSQRKRVGLIDMIGISPGCQHQGVGRTLVEAFHKECNRQKAPMRGIVREGDERLGNFLAALGFRKRNIAIYEKDK